MVNELQAVIAELGGEGVIGRTLRTDNDLRAAIREGFPQKVVGSVMNSAGLTLKELSATLDLSPRSLQRRRHQGRLARYESDRLYRLARIVALAKRYIGDEETATRWLRRPNRALGGNNPLELIDTELGARAVEDVLGRIAFGGVSWFGYTESSGDLTRGRRSTVKALIDLEAGGRVQARAWPIWQSTSLWP